MRDIPSESEIFDLGKSRAAAVKQKAASDTALHKQDHMAKLVDRSMCRWSVWFAE
jgi:hypothetical protein